MTDIHLPIVARMADYIVHAPAAHMAAIAGDLPPSGAAWEGHPAVLKQQSSPLGGGASTPIERSITAGITAEATAHGSAQDSARSMPLSTGAFPYNP